MFPVPATERPPSVKGYGDDQSSSTSLEIFCGYVPVPMVIPGERYGTGTKRPWFSREE